MFDLRELQQLAEQQYSIEETRRNLGQIAEFFKAMSYHQEAMQIAMCNERKLSMQIAEECGCFWVDEDLTISDIPEEFRAESLGLVRWNRITYEGRLVFPVYDVKRQIMGMCGWDKFAQPKYLDSMNHGYKAKRTSLYGMENIETYYNSNELVFVPEGIICSLWLRQNSLQSLALLGSDLTPYVLQILKRFGKRLVIVADNDSVGEDCGTRSADELAGEHLIKKAKRLLPQATLIQCIPYKDLDDTRKKEDGKYEQLLIKELNGLSNPFIQRAVIRVR